jgi:hypothetical protein
MEQKTPLVCNCESCGKEAEMTIKCEEEVIGEKPSQTGSRPKPGKRPWCAPSVVKKLT